MQKDGTYSVVPRIPGGEITPQKLKVIAEVATDYGLYTKITGGQRIDMFGARLEQLPEIWKILVEAGFESGQAYGKSLRTVKSCVGSTWCRFGVQDSVAMAINLELRYRGLRAPHKFKLGVSGCARECAEARGKDVGVIATEQGWNMYVGGNGGFQPAHAQLLAQDLDDETLIRYIDRYLMYYIRTGDRLQRTARWQEDLEGGLDHVRDVVVNDSLGIAEELELAMAQHIGNYEDEWAATLKDPERLRRFRSFVNAPEHPRPRDRAGDGTRAASTGHRTRACRACLPVLTIPMRPGAPTERLAMELDLDLRARRVLIVGRFREARHAIARYLRAEATVTLACSSAAPAVGRSSRRRPAGRPRRSGGMSSRRSTSSLPSTSNRTPSLMLAAACRAHRAWLSREAAAPTTPVGRVTLVGGGPGDEGLFTLAGKAALRDADVVYYDRLAPHSDLDVVGRRRRVRRCRQKAGSPCRSATPDRRG